MAVGGKGDSRGANVPGNHRALARIRSHRALAGVITALALGVMWSCSVEKNYKLLSFVFDGVPNPADKAKGPGQGGPVRSLRDSPTYSIHKPFADDQCAECHSKTFELGTADSSMCLKCHAGTPSEYPKMHGPVAAVACLWCHAPHESAESHLLKKPPRDVCVQCHEEGLLSVQKVPAHADITRACTECHSGHGGTALFYLRSPGEPAPARAKISGSSAPPNASEPRPR
jgi:predicted CXXCH cytochrome family protein